MLFLDMFMLLSSANNVLQDRIPIIQVLQQIGDSTGITWELEQTAEKFDPFTIDEKYLAVECGPDSHVEEKKE
jgi:hypothetical protein